MTHTPESLQHWPLVVGVYRDALQLDDYQAQLWRWEHWFARRERFAVLRVFATVESLSHPPGSAPLAKDWLRRSGPAMREWVMGMATVVLPPDGYARMRHFQTEKAFGVPGGVFPAPQEALQWLRDAIFTPAGLALPPLAVDDDALR